MAKASQKSKVGGNHNPKGKGGFADRPQDRNTKAGPGRGHKRKVVFGTEVLADMEAAYRTPPDIKERAGIKAARKLLASNYEKFMTLYTKAKEGAGPRPTEAPQETVEAATVATAKEAKVEDLIDRLLRAFETEEASHAVP